MELPCKHVGYYPMRSLAVRFKTLYIQTVSSRVEAASAARYPITPCQSRSEAASSLSSRTRHAALRLAFRVNGAYARRQISGPEKAVYVLCCPCAYCVKNGGRWGSA